MTDDDATRRREAFVRRNRAARQQLLDAAPRSDEPVGDDIPVTSFGKGLEHDADGVPTAGAYRSLVAAVEDGSVEGFNAIDLAGDGVPGTAPADASRRLVEPNGALAFQDKGADPHTIQIRPHPAFSSAQAGAEMVELYWRALCRDVPFGDYDGSATVGDAVADLAGLAGYAGPRSDADPRSGGLSPATVFRGVLPGAQTGPRISQFLWTDVPRGAIPLSQRIRVLTGASASTEFRSGSDTSLTLEGPDYLTDFGDWLAVQNGVPVPDVNPPPNLVARRDDPDEQVTRHIVTGRDLANKVRRQVPYLSHRDAAEILLGLGVPKDPHVPYQQAKDFDNDGSTTLRPSATEGTPGVRTGRPFLNFGAHDVLDTVVDVFMPGQNACWYRKWAVHRRLRPEEYGGRVHVHRTRDRSFDLPANLLDSEALSQTESEFGSALLPQAYTEGSPTHPSFPAGHSGVAGACVTVLKAMFDGSHELTNDELVVPVADGTTEAALAHGGSTTVTQTRLESVADLAGSGALGATAAEIDDAASATVTVTDELNKLAVNMALGRNWAGIHYRTDGIDGFLLGEQAAVRYLQDHLRSHSLPFDGYRLETFFDAYPGTLDGAAPNLDRGTILIRPDEIVDNPDDAPVEVDDPVG
jgi:hypothetical protein